MIEITANIARELERLCAKYSVRELTLFGSAAREDFKSTSDVDLMYRLDPDSKLTYFDIFRLQEELETLFGRKVDLVSKDWIKPTFAKHALQNTSVLYAS